MRRDRQTKQTSEKTGAFITSVDIIGISVIYNNITARKIVQNLNPRSEKKEITESFVTTFLFNNRSLQLAIISVIPVILTQVLCHAFLRLLRSAKRSICIVLTNKETITYTCFKFLIGKKLLRNKMKN